MHLSKEIKDFIDAELKSNKSLKYKEVIETIARKFGVRISQSAVSKRAKSLEIGFCRGRKRIFPVGKRPRHSIFLECAGAFFLKGAELEMGLLAAVNQVFRASTKSAQARRVLRLARQLNALLLYAPVFGLKTIQDIVGCKQRGLLYLTEQKGLPEQGVIAQYLRYLTDQKLLPLIINEVAKNCPEALYIRIDFGKQLFYLDAQCRTVWPNAKIPRYLTSTLNKTEGYVKGLFQSPSPQRPLILQVVPGYTFLPPEMFNLLQCFEQAQDKSISRSIIADRHGETLGLWEDLRLRQKCYFIAPLSPWQYARLAGTKVIKDFQQYVIGPGKESMAVADAQVNLLNTQLNKTIRLRAALVRRKEERLALITNISLREERYIRRIVEHYFSRWPQEKLATYYDLLEETHEEALSRSRTADLTSLLTESYNQKPLGLFALFLEYLNRYALTHFFPSEYEKEDLRAMCAKFYQQSGYLKIRRIGWELILRPFAQKELQKSAHIACQRFNQSGIELPAQKSLRIYLM